MPYDPAFLLRKSWATPDELAQELYAMMLEGVKLPVVPAQPGRVPVRPVPQPAVVLARQGIILPPGASVPIIASQQPPSLELSRPRPELAPLLSRVQPAPEPLLQPEALPISFPRQEPQLSAQFQHPQLVSPLPAQIVPRVQSARVPAPSVSAGLPVALETSVISAAPDFMPPESRPLPSVSEEVRSPELRSVAALLPLAADILAEFTHFIPSLRERPGFQAAAVPSSLPTGTPPLAEGKLAPGEFPLAPVSFSEVSRKALEIPAEDVEPAVIPEPAIPLIRTVMVQIDKDGVTALKTPATGGEGQGTPGQGKALVLDFNGNNLTIDSNEPITVWNLGDAIGPNVYTEALLIQEQHWWVIGRSPGGAFFADHLNIAGATGLLTAITLHSTTGNVYRINNSAMVLYKSSATIWNGMPNSTNSAKRQFLNENVDGTFSVVTESCATV